jgi:hypothetical protein
LNQIFQERFYSIPVGQLINRSQQVQPGSVEKTAKLKFDFLPPGLLEINSLSGIFLFIAIIAVSFIVRLILLRI